jgi:hypothetical protein
MSRTGPPAACATLFIAAVLAVCAGDAGAQQLSVRHYQVAAADRLPRVVRDWIQTIA